MTDHADLIARLEALRDETPKTEAWERPLLSGHASYADRLHAAITEAAATLADSVPREQYDDLFRTSAAGIAHYAGIERERDEARGQLAAVQAWRKGLGEGYAGPGGIILDLDAALAAASAAAIRAEAAEEGTITA